MSLYRPYYDAESFRYPSGSTAKLSEDTSVVESFDYLDIDELVAGQSQLSAVGTSVGKFYARMLISQPFDVAKFLLQVGDWSGTEGATASYNDYSFSSEEGSSSDEEVDYFIDVRDTATGAKSQATRPKVKASKSRKVQLYSEPTATLFPEAIKLRGGPYIFSMLGGLSDKEGLFGLWRALNAACLSRAATGIVQAWATGFLASFTNTPDPQFVDIMQAVDPSRLIAVGVGGCALAAALLTPLYMIRARLIATSMSVPDRPRSLRWSLLHDVRSGQIIAPWWVVLPTTLAASVQELVASCAPLVIWRYFGVEVFSMPRWYRFSRLCANIIGLGLKMPLETFANRAQLKAVHPSARSLIVRPAEYNGILPTLWAIARREQALSTLYRGWRSEVVGVISEWGYDALDEGRQTQQERF